MNNNDRKEFWITLCSLDGEDIKKDIKKLDEKIKIPKNLYRYRAVNISNLEALRTNNMFFSTANYYDDPFDTFLHIDIEAIKKEFESNFNSKDNIKYYIEGFRAIVGDSLNSVLQIDDVSEFNVEKISNLLEGGLVNRFLDYVIELRNELKKDIFSVCFSEKGFNETLWLKYANQHKGFVLTYDLEDNKKLLCGTMEKCNDCGINIFGTSLLPIYYSDEKYDATNFAKYMIMKNFEKIVPSVKLTETFITNRSSLAWEDKKCALIKKKCHEHDVEWRMMTNCNMKPPIKREWIPSGLILGLRMNTKEEKLILSIAQQAGIEKFYKSYINKNGDLDAYRVNFKGELRER